MLNPLSSAPLPAAAPSGVALHGNYVLLRADELRLLLPQSDVGAAEFLETGLEASTQPGLLQAADASNTRRYVALSARMTPLVQSPEGRFLSTTLNDGASQPDEAVLHWCWSEVQVLIDVALAAHPLPPALLTPYTPVKQYVEMGGQAVFVSSAAQVREYLRLQGV